MVGLELKSGVRGAAEQVYHKSTKLVVGGQTDCFTRPAQRSAGGEASGGGGGGDTGWVVHPVSAWGPNRHGC